MVINELRVGRRVWSFAGYFEQGHDKVTVPANTSGIIVSAFNEFGFDNPLYTVQWDTGEKSTYYGNELTCIGECHTWAEFEETVVRDALRAEKRIGPMGGVRGFKVFLRSGDTALGCISVEPLLAQANIPIEIYQISRKQRRDKMK